MKKHHLYGRKTPGPYTKLGNQIFDGVGSGVSSAGSMLGTATGAAYEGASSVGQGISSAGSSMLNSGKDFNTWMQEEYASFDHTEGVDDEDRPFTRNDGMLED